MSPLRSPFPDVRSNGGRRSFPRRGPQAAGTPSVWACLLAALLLPGCGEEGPPDPVPSDAADHAEHVGHTSPMSPPVQEPTGHEDHAGHGEQDPTDPDEHAGHLGMDDPGGHESAIVRIDDDTAQRLGVAFAEARRERMTRVIRGTGEVRWDETRLSTVSLRFGGWAERLHVDYTGRRVHVGDPLLEVYSPELVAAQEDLLSALRLSGSLRGSRVPGTLQQGDEVVEAARERLRWWQVSEGDIRQVEQSGRVQEHLTLASPSGGFVVEKNIQNGERFEAGAPLYRLADLSQVWVEIEVYEQDVRHLRTGGHVEIEVAAYPEERWHGTVAYVHPDVQVDRRTVRVRVELPNPGERLRPGMFATSRTDVTVAEDAITVPRDAVLFTGERAVIFVAHGEGRYEGRDVRTGAEAGDRVQILAGLAVGERVVARAGFLLDAESRLMESMMGQPGMPGMDMGHGDHGDHASDPGGPDA